ncbi:MAG TPA: hypothetical protein VK589_23280 [Chryseolinea sp.]|nr:hypothetical protein [Chryseolinea sp.]
MPLNKKSDGTYYDEPEEAGTYEYFPDKKTLVFTKDFFVVTYTIEKYTTDQLHLSREGQTYRLQRK